MEWIDIKQRLKRYGFQGILLTLKIENSGLTFHILYNRPDNRNEMTLYLEQDYIGLDNILLLRANTDLIDDQWLDDLFLCLDKFKEYVSELIDCGFEFSWEIPKESEYNYLKKFNDNFKGTLARFRVPVNNEEKSSTGKPVLYKTIVLNQHIDYNDCELLILKEDGSFDLLEMFPSELYINIDKKTVSTSLNYQFWIPDINKIKAYLLS